MFIIFNKKKVEKIAIASSNAIAVFDFYSQRLNSNWVSINDFKLDPFVVGVLCGLSEFFIKMELGENAGGSEIIKTFERSYKNIFKYEKKENIAKAVLLNFNEPKTIDSRAQGLKEMYEMMTLNKSFESSHKIPLFMDRAIQIEAIRRF